jgi:opacity protein-like surface antigen
MRSSMLLAALWTAAALAGFSTVGPSPAHAQAIEGAVRLHLEVPFLAYQSTTSTLEGVDDGTTASTVAVGPGDAGLGFGIGYGLSDMLVLGTNVALQFRSINTENSDSVTGVGFQLMPYLEAVFGSDSARPFVGANLILQINDVDDFSSTLFGAGALGGVHLFLTDSLSFDLSARLYFLTGSRHVTTTIVDLENDVTQIGLLALIGISGWS